MAFFSRCNLLAFSKDVSFHETNCSEAYPFFGVFVCVFCIAK